MFSFFSKLSAASWFDILITLSIKPPDAANAWTEVIHK